MNKHFVILGIALGVMVLSLAMIAGIVHALDDDSYRILHGPYDNTPYAVKYAGKMVSCTDTDNGLDIFVAGKVMDQWGRVGVDSCLRDNKVREFYCGNGNLLYRAVFCPRGSNCNDGACMRSVFCGNGACEVGESCSSCPSDCGACPSKT